MRPTSAPRFAASLASNYLVPTRIAGTAPPPPAPPVPKRVISRHCEHPVPCGCPQATALLEKPSCCERCPFPDCPGRSLGAPRKKLTPRRQRAAAMLAGQGASAAEIAGELGVSLSTVYRLLDRGRGA